MLVLATVFSISLCTIEPAMSDHPLRRELSLKTSGDGWWFAWFCEQVGTGGVGRAHGHHELLIATSIVPMWYLHMQLSNTHPHRHTGMHVHNLKNFYTHVSIYFLLEILLFILFFFLFLLKIKQFEWSCQKLPIKRIVASDVTEIWKTSKSADLAGTVTFISMHPYRQKLQ